MFLYQSVDIPKAAMQYNSPSYLYSGQENEVWNDAASPVIADGNAGVSQQLLSYPPQSSPVPPQPRQIHVNSTIDADISKLCSSMFR